MFALSLQALNHEIKQVATPKSKLEASTPRTKAAAGWVLLRLPKTSLNLSSSSRKLISSNHHLKDNSKIVLRIQPLDLGTSL